jgi:hypothetical protein
MPSRLAKSFPAPRVRIRMVRFGKRRSCGNGNSVHQPNLLAGSLISGDEKRLAAGRRALGQLLANGLEIRETALPLAGVLGSRVNAES